jgi:hypothetical protein
MHQENFTFTLPFTHRSYKALLAYITVCHNGTKLKEISWNKNKITRVTNPLIKWPQSVKQKQKLQSLPWLMRMCIFAGLLLFGVISTLNICNA